MDFDNPKFYGDTSITDGLVSMKRNQDGTFEFGSSGRHTSFTLWIHASCIHASWIRTSHYGYMHHVYMHHGYMHHIMDTCIKDTSAWVTRPERPKGMKDKVKEARRAAH